MNLLKISGSPHFHNNDSVSKVMWTVVIAMLPALLVSFYMFGLGAIIVLTTSVISCIIVEFIIQKYLLKQKTTITDGSAIVTGILLAFNLPSNLPIHIIIIGAIVSIGIGKMTFGGLGKNIFNPALVGRVFLLISFPVEMTSWPNPIDTQWLLPNQITDAFTGATPLAILKDGISKGHDIAAIISSNEMLSYKNLLFGKISGSLGEVSALALILGGIFLLIRKVITWHIPISFIGSVVIFSGILWLVNPNIYADPLFHLLSGGIMLGVFFMATDMVTSPMSKTGQLIFGFGCGIITILIRVFGVYPEGVSFAILIMNATVPLLDKAFKQKKFGGA